MSLGCMGAHFMKGTNYGSWLMHFLLLFKLSSNQKMSLQKQLCIAVVKIKVRQLDDKITLKISDALCLLSILRTETPKVQVCSQDNWFYWLATPGLPILCSQQGGRVRGLLSWGCDGGDHPQEKEQARGNNLEGWGWRWKEKRGIRASQQYCLAVWEHLTFKMVII